MRAFAHPWLSKKLTGIDPYPGMDHDVSFPLLDLDREINDQCEA
jgi:hypothetical protein